ncbi:MAG: enoyl-CoA hydratase/isomerase family protein, partial [Myxococcota bacterium]
MADQDKYETLDIRVDDNLCWLTLNRPESLNAMNRQLVTDLREFISQLPDRRDIRVVILKGAGRAFCAGLDIKESAAPSLTSDDGNRVTKGLRMQRRIADLVMMMRRAPQPFIACVQGAASGGGFA